MEQARANVAALRALASIERDGRSPSEDELSALRGYSGWGGCADAFASDFTGRPAWAAVNAELRGLLTEDEYAAARASTLTAFYTPTPVIASIESALGAAGFGTSGRRASVLEPGCGTGRFIGVAPGCGLSCDFTGVELDRVSARIARVLHPQASIVNGALEDCHVSHDSFDLVVGNVPFSDAITVADEETGRNVPIHDYFLIESLRAVRPGGIVALITSRYTMDKASASTRERLADKADLIAAARLPVETFSGSANTDVVSDLLVFKRRGEDDAAPVEEPGWVGTVRLPGGSSANRLFVENPDLVIGSLRETTGRFGATITVDSGLTADGVARRLAESLSRQLASHGDIAAQLGPAQGEAFAALRPEPTVYEYALDESGRVWFGDASSVEPVTFSSKADERRLAAMVSLRDKVRETLALERVSSDDEEVAGAIASLDAEYDAFVAEHGYVSSAANQRAWRARSDLSIAQLSSIEIVDANRRFQRKADILLKRVQAPAPPLPERFEDPADALSASIDRFGLVDLPFIAGILQLGEDDALAALGDRVVNDPISGRLVLADEFLSGDVGGKIAEIDRLIDAEAAAPARARLSGWISSCGLEEVLDDIEEQDRGARTAMRELVSSGAWGAFVDPIHAQSFSDVDAAISAPAVQRAGRGGHPSFMRRLVDDVQEDASLAHYDPKRPDVIVADGIWALAAQTGYITDVEYAAEAAYAFDHPDKVGDEALMVLVTGLTYREYLKEGIERLMSDLEFDPDVRRGYASIRVTDFSRKLLEALKANPEVFEYLARSGWETEREDSETPRYYNPRFTSPFRNATPEGLEEWRKRRIAALSAGAQGIDEHRVAELRNLRARLADALPPRLTASEIKASLGSPWIPACYYHQFAVETFEMESCSDAEKRHLVVSHSEETGSWQVRFSGSGGASLSAEQKYGIPERTSLSIFESALNKSSLEVTKPDPSDPSGKKRAKDPKATAAAWSKRHAIEEAFEKWVFADEDRARTLTDLYNRRFNNIAPRTYDGSYLTLPGSNPQITLRRHQKDAVARILNSDSGTLIAHVVGAGKTFTGVAAIAEAKRLGKAAKPMVVVPNHLTEQWASDFLRLYPDSKVLYMTAADMKSSDAVRMFWGRAAAGDWDAIVVGQSRFDRLELSREYRSQRLEARAQEFEDSIREAKEAGQDKSFTVKELEKLKKRAELMAKRLREQQVEEGVTFEEVGCDFLFVDEAHGYKNLAVATSMNVAGITGTSSMKCEGLLDKCEYLRERGYGSNIVFATGTPVSNTISELFNMERYLSPGLLRAQGTSTFSAWASAFGDIVDSVEVRPEGTGFQVKQRFAKFHNLPELMNGFHAFADIMTEEDLDLDVPDCTVKTVAVPATERQKELIGELAERAQAVRDGKVDPEADNMLKITSEGRKLALDPKLLAVDDDGVEPMDGGKVDVCARNVLDVYRRTDAEHGCQLVFCDTSTPASGKWNIYSDLKERLVALGVPEGEIAFVSDAGNNPKKREELFERVNAGKVRVLLGSTQKLGTGTNVQRRLAAIHDLDCPWRPSDLEQRLGRIKRQGNTYGQVEDYRYVTVGTFDSYLYQTVERKQRFVSQIFTNRSPVREADDLDETVISYAQIKAIATGDPSMQRRMELENSISQLKLLRQAFFDGQRTLRQRIETVYRPQSSSLAEDFGKVEADQEAFARARELRDSSDKFSIEVGGVAYDDKKEASRAITALRDAGRVGELLPIGSYCGLSVGIFTERTFLPEGDVVFTPRLAVSGKERHTSSRRLALESSGAVRQLNEIIDDIADGSPRLKKRFESARRDLDSALAALAEPWEGEADLLEKERELAALGSPVESEPELGHEAVEGATGATLDGSSEAPADDSHCDDVAFDDAWDHACEDFARKLSDAASRGPASFISLAKAAAGRQSELAEERHGRSL